MQYVRCKVLAGVTCRLDDDVMRTLQQVHDHDYGMLPKRTHGCASSGLTQAWLRMVKSRSLWSVALACSLACFVLNIAAVADRTLRVTRLTTRR